MDIEFNNKLPIYIQIMNIIKQNIMTSKLKAGDKLLSIREMAEEHCVNHNTIQRVYQELEKEELIFTQRGMGTFITNNTEKIEEMKSKMSMNIIITFIQSMRDLGINPEESLVILEKYIRKEQEN